MKVSPYDGKVRKAGKEEREKKKNIPTLLVRSSSPSQKSEGKIVLSINDK